MLKTAKNLLKTAKKSLFSSKNNTKIDNHLILNWKHILGDNCSIRRTSRGIKIEYQKKKEGNRRKGTEKELEVPLESFRIEE